MVEFLGSQTKMEAALQAANTARMYKQREGYSRFFPRKLTTMHIAASAGETNVMVSQLGNQGAAGNAKDGDGKTPLAWAVEKGHHSIVLLLLADSRTDLDSRNFRGKTPLSVAAEKGYTETVKQLLDHGANPNLQDIARVTPLWYAAQRGHAAVRQLLLDIGAMNPELSIAAKSGREAVVKMLLAEKNVKPDQTVSEGRTPLSLAAEHGHEAVVEQLLRNEYVDTDCKDYNGRTSLSWIMNPRWGHDSDRLGEYQGVVTQLLATGRVDPNCGDVSGRTPLSYAAEGGCLALVKTILGRACTPRPGKTYYQIRPRRPLIVRKR